MGWFKSIIVNETWPALADPSVGGWSRLFGAWCLLLGIVNYLYFGLNSTGWIDPSLLVNDWTSHLDLLSTIFHLPQKAKKILIIS